MAQKSPSKNHSLVLLVFFLLSPLSVLAQDGIRFQAVARDNGGQALAAQTITVRLTILRGSLPGTNEYQETHSLVTDDFGLFSLSIGQGSPTLGTFAGITWPDGLERHLQVELNTGTGYVNLGTTAFVSVPLAIHAETSEIATNMALNDLQDVEALSPTANEALKWNGSHYVPANGYLTLHRSDNTLSTLRLSHTGSTSGGYLQQSGNRLSLINTESGMIQMGVNTNTVFRLDQYGNLGLGPMSTNPMNDLHLHRGGGTNNFLQISHGGSNPTSADGMVIGLAAGSSDGIINHRQNKPVRFYTNNQLRMTLEAAGQLTLNNLSGAGIRTVVATPNGSLISGPIISDIDKQTLSLSGQTLSISNGNSVVLPEDADWHEIGNVVYNNTADVGIGTASPQGRLHVNGPSGEENPIFYFTPATSGSGDTSTIFMGENQAASYGMGLRYDGSGNELEIYGKASSNEYGPHLTVHRTTGDVTIADLAGTGTRNVVVDASGRLGTESLGLTHIMISDRAFEPTSSSASYIRSIGAGLEGTYLTTSSAMTFVAPVQFPQGAQPENMTFYFFDALSTINIRAALYRRSLIGGTANVGSAISSGSSGSGTATVSFGSFTVDNTDEVWEVQITVTGGSPNVWPGNSNLKFKGVSITYQNP
jgi:hypothetical protein